LPKQGKSAAPAGQPMIIGASKALGMEKAEGTVRAAVTKLAWYSTSVMGGLTQNEVHVRSGGKQAVPVTELMKLP
jgi:hypothetical protein